MISREQVVAQLPEAQLCPACGKLAAYISNQEEWHQKRCGLKRPENLKRIHIIGGPGSGKTTLARELGKYLGIETHELDQVAFTGPDYMERPLQDRVADIYKIANRPAWITEGLFVEWTDELLANANMVIWLDHIGWERGILRIARRYFQSAVNEAKRRQGLQRFTRFQDYARHVKQFIKVIFSSRAYYTGNSLESSASRESRLKTSTSLIPYKDKVVHCYDDQAVETFINYIRVCHESCR